MFSGVLDADITYKAIYESDADYNLYLQALQNNPTTMVLTQPVGAGVNAGGASLTLTTTQGGWSKGKPDVSGTYVQADFEVNGVYNATDSGLAPGGAEEFRDRGLLRSTPRPCPRVRASRHGRGLTPSTPSRTRRSSCRATPTRTACC